METEELHGFVLKDCTLTHLNIEILVKTPYGYDVFCCVNTVCIPCTVSEHPMINEAALFMSSFMRHGYLCCINDVQFIICSINEC